MKCLLHIGTEKTGTTILQDWLYDNKAALGKVGIYLSENLGKTNNRLIPAYFQGSLDNWALRAGIGTEEEKERYFDGFLEKLANEILNASKSHEVFVISSEHLHSRLRNKEEIERLHSFLVGVFDLVEVVCYFRDQFDVAVSLYSTVLKVNSISTLEAFVDQANPDNYYYNYLAIANNWSAVFGRGNCNFRIYDRARFAANDIRQDFLGIIKSGINTDGFNMERISSNESLSMLQAVAYKVINRNIPYLRPDKLALNPENGIAKMKLSEIHSLKFGKIFSAQRKLITDRFSETNAIFFEKYFEIGDRFPNVDEDCDCCITCEQASNAVEDALEFGIKLNEDVKHTLSDTQINLLRDFALRLYDENLYSIEDALAIMKIGLYQRPNDSFINNKVEEWSSKLKSNLDE